MLNYKVSDQFIVSGCYDGQLYVFSAEDGSPYWTFSTLHSEEEPLPIKSSPCVDPVSGHLWFGSHDHHMYAVDIYVSVSMYSFYVTIMCQRPFKMSHI